MIKDTLGLIERIVTEIRKNVDVAVIGLSGGADSTLVAILCMKALGKENVCGLHLPFGDVDKETFNKRSVQFAEHLGINHLTIDIKDSLNNLSSQLERYYPLDKLTNGNTRARLRMTSLYLTAGVIGNQNPQKRVRVMNTCNLSESYVGYETKWGDSAGDLCPIGEFFKSEVYQLLDFFKRESIITEEFIDRVPSPGLWPSQTDEGELGHTYNEMEQAIKWITGEKIPENKQVTPEQIQIIKFVQQRHEANKHKQGLIPIIKIRDMMN